MHEALRRKPKRDVSLGQCFDRRQFRDGGSLNQAVEKGAGGSSARPLCWLERLRWLPFLKGGVCHAKRLANLFLVDEHRRGDIGWHLDRVRDAFHGFGRSRAI